MLCSGLMIVRNLWQTGLIISFNFPNFSILENNLYLIDFGLDSNVLLFHRKVILHYRNKCRHIIVAMYVGKYGYVYCKTLLQWSHS